MPFGAGFCVLTASESPQLLVPVQIMAPYKHFLPFLLASVQTLDLCEHREIRLCIYVGITDRQGTSCESINLLHILQ